MLAKVLANTTAGNVKAQDLKDAWMIIAQLLNPHFGTKTAEETAWFKKHKDLFDKAVKKSKVETFRIKDVASKWIVNQHGRTVPDKYLQNPIVVVNDRYVMDGNHRLITKFLRGDETVEAMRLKLPWANELDAMEGYPLSEVKEAEANIIDERFNEEPHRQDYMDALPFEGPWNGYGQKSPIEKVYPAISRVLPSMLDKVLADMIDERFLEPDSGYRKDFVLPVDQTYGWGMGNGVAVEPNPFGGIGRAFAKATLPEDSELLQFYYLADRDGWVEEQREEGERQFGYDSKTKEEKNQIARDLLDDGWNGWSEDQFKKATPEERLQAIKDYYVHKWVYDSEDENASSTETHFNNARIISNPTLVRFTDQPPEEILSKGFEGYGPEHLGLTTHYRPSPNGTLAFGVNKKKELKSPQDWKNWASKYGQYAFEFKVPYAVEAYHESDGEDQVVFDVTTVKDLKQVEFPKQKIPSLRPMRKGEKIPF